MVNTTGSMGLLDDVNPLYTPPFSRKFRKETALSQEERDSDLNNFDRDEMREDFTDSPHLDY
jgi:hypothetical protein